MLRRHFLAAALAADTPRSYALRLSQVYGQSITAMVYTQTFSLIGRLRLGQARPVSEILEPYLSGQKDPLDKPTASHYSGHLPLALLKDTRAKSLLTRAAAAAAENPLDNEMSDSVFMVCPLLAEAGLHDRAVSHYKKMESLCLRPDGIWRHSPLCDAAWGRGNAFPLLGLALTLTKLPSSHPGFPQLQNAFSRLAQSLAKHQRDDGMFRQLIDVPEAWPEFSSTAMIAAALHRGVKNRWLSRSPYESKIQSAWRAVQSRTSPDGAVDGVCESTGKQTSAQAYLDRKSLTGQDPRGGAMALFLATELS
jgi:unsaturated rhamnogalacturonyl hydrolase